MHLAAQATRLRRTLAVVIVGCLASLLGYWAALSADRHAAERELLYRARLDGQILEARFSDLEHPVLAAADFIAADSDLRSADFEHFASYIAPDFAALVWLGWAPLVRDADRDPFEAAAQSDHPGFRIADQGTNGTLLPAPRRGEYVPLLAARRFTMGSIPWGLDLAGSAEQAAALRRARDEGRPIATTPGAGTDPSDSNAIATMVAPVYRPGTTAPADVTARRDALLGYVVAAYKVDAVLRYVAGGLPGGTEQISFSRNMPAGKSGQAVAVTAQGGAIAAVGLPPPVPAHGGIRLSRPVFFSGQDWVATFAFPPEIVAALRSYAPFGWLGAGLLLTATIGSMTARTEAHRLATERLVGIRTRELSSANERLRQSAELLQATLHAAPLAIVVLDRESRITLWNRGAERIFGYTAREALDKSYVDLVVPEHLRSEALALHASIGAREPPGTIEVQRLRRDGSSLDLRVAGSALHDAAGELRGVVYAIEDLTETLKLTAQLHQAQKMEAIGQLTGGLAHDFNNLLGIAITSLDLLRDRTKDDPEDDQLAADALDALLHGADLVRRLLAFARRQPLQPECVGLNDLVAESARLLRPLLGTGIEVELDLATSLWRVLVDRAQFETTLINLATNARDAMPNGGRLAITTHNARVAVDSADRDQEVPPGDYVSVEIRDSGCGMPRHVLQHVFEPFFTTKPKGVGTGLGLSMVLGFIKQSGGHITVDSQEGGGTCFRLYLARHLADAQSSELPASEPPVDRKQVSHDRRILLVEDNVVLRRVTAQGLRRLGYQVYEAGNAADALIMLESGQGIDLLFSDVRMPGNLNGFDLAKAARERWPALRILLTSGFPEECTGEMVAAAGFRLLRKPYREDALVSALADVLAS